MSNEINYKNKYEQLKSQFMASVDTAFRLGYEQGAQEAQMENLQTQQQQADAQAQAAKQQPGQPDADAAPGQEETDPNEAPQPGDQEPTNLQDSENPAGSELDQHIATLEGMLGKSELTGEDLQKALKEVKSFKEKIAIRKNDKAVKAIAKSLKKPFTVGKQATHNLNSNAKDALSMQEKIVSDVMHKWEEQEQSAAKGILDILSVENLTKK